MGKTLGNPELPLILLRQPLTHPAAEGGAVSAQVNRYIEYLAPHHTYQFTLRLLYLIMQTAQHIVCTATVVILHETDATANRLLKPGMIEALVEETAII